MSALSFQIAGARPERHAAVPTLLLGVRIEAAGGAALENLALRCLLQIEPRRRAYSPAEEARLIELFGVTPQWGDTLKPFVWTNASWQVPAFRARTEIELPIACSYDFEVAAAKYLHSLDDGEIPLRILFNGTSFTRTETGLAAAPIAWDREASYRLPTKVWRELMDCYYPNAGWLRLERETLNALLRYKARRALPTWDGVIAALLGEEGAR